MPTSCRRFVGRVALVTASTAGIGLATAERLMAEGATVVICSRSQANVDAALASLRATWAAGAAPSPGQAAAAPMTGVPGAAPVYGVAANINTASGVAATLAAVAEACGPNAPPRLDVLVSNSAANPVAGPVLSASVPDSAVTKVLDSNIAAHLRLVRAAAPLLRAGSAIVLVSSITAFRPELAPISLYAISKTGLVALSRVLATELAPRGVRVNCIAPGTVATKFAAALVESEAAREEAEARTLVGRLGTAAEIAAAIAFLASDDASYVVGETLAVSGGMIAGRL